MSETATTVGRMHYKAPASGATMVPEKPEQALFIPKSTLIASVLAVTMLSPPVVETTKWSLVHGGETVNRDLSLVDGAVVEQDHVDLDTLHFAAEVMPLPVGFRLAEIDSPFPSVDPDLLALDE